MRKLGLLLGLGLVLLTSCVRDCEYLYTDDYIETDPWTGFSYRVVEDVYECEVIVRDRVLINNDDNVIVE